MAKKTWAERSNAAKKAADTRAKKVLASIPANKNKFDHLGATPEERRAAIRQQKIAEIQKAEQEKKDKEAATRSEAGRKAAATRQKKAESEADGNLRTLVKQIKACDEKQGIELLKDFLAK